MLLLSQGLTHLEHFSPDRLTAIPERCVADEKVEESIDVLRGEVDRSQAQSSGNGFSVAPWILDCE